MRTMKCRFCSLCMAGLVWALTIAPAYAQMPTTKRFPQITVEELNAQQAKLHIVGRAVEAVLLKALALKVLHGAPGPRVMVKLDAIDQKVARPVIFKSDKRGCVGAHRRSV